MINKDTLICVLSDMHSGGSTALFPNRFWQGEHQNHTPTGMQKKMWRHFEYCANLIKKNRKGKRLVVVHDGDAIEGVHHASPQQVTRLKNEQIEIHAELMDWFLREVGHGRNDKLYYTLGTETHTDDNEELCAADLGAEETPDGGHVFSLLKLNINNRSFWFTHHGPSAGRGVNKGNRMRIFLRDIFWTSINREESPPDMVITGHTHDPIYNIYVQNYRDGHRVVHGIICPSWQQKTRFAYRVSPVDVNKIGLVLFDVLKDGTIIVPEKFPIMEDEIQETRL